MKTSKEAKKVYASYKKTKMTGSMVMSLKEFARDQIESGGKYEDLFEQWLLNKAVG